MTQKENLLKQAIELENEARTINGEKTKEIDTERWRFVKEAQESKVYELKERIESARRKIEDAKKHQIERQWLATDEGKAYAERLEMAKEEVSNAYNDAENSAIKGLNITIKRELGNQWGLCCFSETHIEIGIVDESQPKNESGTYREIFGHSFDIYLGTDIYGEERFDINYGCMGSFNPDKEEKRVDFLVGLAKFAYDKRLQNVVKTIIDIYKTIVKDVNNKYKSVKAEGEALLNAYIKEQKEEAE